MIGKMQLVNHLKHVLNVALKMEVLLAMIGKMQLVNHLKHVLNAKKRRVYLKNIIMKKASVFIAKLKIPIILI